MHVQRILNLFGAIKLDMFANLFDNSLPILFQLAARSLCSSNRCFSERLVSYKRVCYEYDRKNLVLDTDITGTHFPGGNILEENTMTTIYTIN